MASALFVIFLVQQDYVPNLAQVAFIEVAIFTLASKVYSPQYILWLTPLAVIALQKKDRSAFWIWQGAEIVYHLAAVSYTHLTLPTNREV